MKQDTLALICWANVAGEFAMFMNPKYQGPNFSWDHWDGSYVAVNVIAMNDIKDKQKSFVNATCMEIARQLKEHAGVDNA